MDKLRLVVSAIAIVGLLAGTVSADVQIFSVVPRPSFPSYVSGHSGFSGAAAEVLGHFFPDERAEVDRLAAEASISRVYGSIHYPFDCDEGLKLGRGVARLALRQAGP